MTYNWKTSSSNIRKARCPGDEVLHMAIYLLKWNICRCWFYLLELPTVWRPAESKQSVVRIRTQYSLVIIMVTICIGNFFTKLWSTKLVQQNFFLTSYSFTEVWIPQSYFYLIIRFLSPYQNSYFTKLKVTLNFSDKLHILITNNIVKSLTLVLNNLKIWYKDTIQVCFTSL